MKATEHRFPKSLDDFSSVGGFLKGVEDFVREKTGDSKVIGTVSGGVDSTLVSEIFKRAIGDDFKALHMDTGYMRKIEGKEECLRVRDRLQGLLGEDNVIFKDARDEFYRNTFFIEKAEPKRINFRETYEDVFNGVLEERGYHIGTQGTIGPDIEETQAELKSQNNVDVNFRLDKLIEPLAGLHKAEVRRVASEVLDDSVYERQPFPGPGLMVRTVGPINGLKLGIERLANDSLEQKLGGYLDGNGVKRYERETGRLSPFQHFTGTFDKEREPADDITDRFDEVDSAYRLDTEVTGKVVDGGMKRIYEKPVVIQGDLDIEEAMELGKEIPMETESTRVFYNLKEFDRSIPSTNSFEVAIRSVESLDARDAYPTRIPVEDLTKIADAIEGNTYGFVDAVSYDVTPKPSRRTKLKRGGTIEFE